MVRILNKGVGVSMNRRIGPNFKKGMQESTGGRIDLVRIWTSSGQMWTKKYGRKSNQPEKFIWNTLINMKMWSLDWKDQNLGVKINLIDCLRFDWLVIKLPAGQIYLNTES